MLARNNSPNKAHQLGQFAALFGLRIRFAQFYANQTMPQITGYGQR